MVHVVGMEQTFLIPPDSNGGNINSRKLMLNVPKSEPRQGGGAAALSGAPRSARAKWIRIEMA
jgi:hypothetical protein